MSQLMEMKHGRISAYHPQCYAQAEVANITIAKFLRNLVDTSRLNWEIFLPPLMFSYSTSVHRWPFCLTFGPNDVQLDFDQEDFQENYFKENSPEYKFQLLQILMWQNAIVRLLLHNNVEIKISKRRNSIAIINKLNLYHSKGQFQSFKDNFPNQTFHFQKQGVMKNLKTILMKKMILKKIYLREPNKSLKRKIQTKIKRKPHRNFRHQKEREEDLENRQTNREEAFSNVQGHR
jgi:hypothetical protein